MLGKVVVALIGFMCCVGVLGRAASSGSGTIGVFGNCVIRANTVFECDGTQRSLTSEDRQALSQYQADTKEYFRQLYPPGFPFVKGNPGPYPKFPQICQTC